MKKFLSVILCSSLLLAACGNGNDNDNVSNPPEDAPVEDENNNGANNGNTATEDNANNDNTATDNNTTNENSGSITFTSFDLDVDYDNFKSFEVEYDNENDGMEAKIEDERNNQKLRGDEAFQELQNRFESFKFDQTTSNDEVIKEVLDSFELDDNYKKFDLEIQYSDGTEKEYQKSNS